MTAADRAAAGAKTAAPLQGLTSPQLVAAAKQYVIPYLTKPANVDAVAALTEGADPGATAQFERELYAADLRPNLSHIGVPLLEIAPFDASLDPRNPAKPFSSAVEKQAYYQSLVAGAPHAAVMVIDDARHFVMYDQPAAFYSAVDGFLKTLP